MIEQILNLLGPFPEKSELNPVVIEQIDCGKYVREKVEYNTEANDRISAYVCVPKNLVNKAPAIFCHHQHNGEYLLGKSEVVGRAGNPDQAYAAELAERGYITLAPDAIAFEERNWGDNSNRAEYFELSSRLLLGKTLMAKAISDVQVGLDYLQSRSDVDSNKMGFIGHSYGGRMALWMPAFDKRIRVSVSHCGCIPYRLSLTHDSGIQMEFCIPDFMSEYDIEDVIKCFESCPLLISAATDDVWSRGAQDVYDRVKNVLGDRVELKLYESKHVFTKSMREYAYAFLDRHLVSSS
jgi:dienelactone hydrolase